MTIVRTLLACAASLTLLAAAPAPQPGRGAQPTPVVLQSRPGTPLDNAARELVATDLAEARAKGETPLVLTGAAALGAASDRPALVVQLQSPRECGSAGCATTVYLWMQGKWKRVLDGTAGPLAVALRTTNGMADLLAGESRYVWTGTEYRDAQPAPAVDLRPRPPRR